MKGNVDYEQIKNSVTALEVGEAKEKSTEGTTIINLITGSDSELAKISKKHDDYLLVVLNRYTSTIDRIPKSITDYSDVISKTNEISTTWENVDFNDTNKVLEGFKKIDTILGLTDQNMLSTMYESAGKPGISTNSIDVEGFIASSINVSNYYPVGEYESREDWKNKLVEKYSSQGYSKEVAEALASLEMAKVLVNATGATNASTANSDIEELEKRYKHENKTNNSKTTSKTNNSSTAKNCCL